MAKKRRRLKPAKPTLTFSLHELIEMSDGLRAQVELLWKVENLINWEVMKHKWTQEEKDWFRHREVCKSLDAGKGWPGSFEDASNRIPKDHPAWGEPGTMETGYKAHEKTLPPEHRRPLTHRPKTPVR
jgi:hypothetical protein